MFTFKNKQELNIQIVKLYKYYFFALAFHLTISLIVGAGADYILLSTLISLIGTYVNIYRFDKIEAITTSLFGLFSIIMAFSLVIHINGALFSFGNHVVVFIALLIGFVLTYFHGSFYTGLKLSEDNIKPAGNKS